MIYCAVNAKLTTDRNLCSLKPPIQYVDFCTDSACGPLLDDEGSAFLTVLLHSRLLYIIKCVIDSLQRVCVGLLPSSVRSKVRED